MRVAAIMLISLFFAVLFIAPLTAGEADHYLIIPGVRVGHIELGRPLSPALLKTFGKPTTYTKPSPGAEGRDTGNYYWKGYFNVKLNDGKGDDNVFQILVMHKKFSTAHGIRVGSSFADVKKAYPEGKKGEGMDVDFSWHVPGMTLDINENKVCAIGVHPKNPWP
jgi:hypothetical protein